MSALTAAWRRLVGAEPLHADRAADVPGDSTGGVVVSGASQAASEPPAPLDDSNPSARLIQEAFWIVLGREISALELRDQLRGFQPEHGPMLIVRLLSSPEFRLLYNDWRGGRETGRDLDVEERGLMALGSDERFVEQAYVFLQGRPVDENGRAHFVSVLAAGERRVNVLRSLVLSDEFTRHYLAVAPDGGFIPRDTQLCELANPAKWDNPEWIELLNDLRAAPDHKLSMHRKAYEFTQLLYGLQRLGMLNEESSVVSVGAGHEPILYWLANHVRRVVATDMYEGKWQTTGSKEGDEGVVSRPDEYTPFPYRTERLVFLKMDGRHLALRDGVFDVAYSLSSIEHFGGLSGAQAAIDEMGRTLKRGGILAVATEYILQGPGHPEAFLPHEIRALFDRPGLRLIQPVDETVYSRYDYRAIDVDRNPHQTPHMVVRIGDTVFTSVMAFFRKE